MRFGASTALIEQASPPLVEGDPPPRDHDASRRPRHTARCCAGRRFDREPAACVSAGEPLPAARCRRVDRATGIRIDRRHRLHRDAAHLHRLARGGRARARTGTPVPGYEAMVVDEAMRTCPPARSAGSRCAARPAAATSTTRARRQYVHRRLEPDRRRVRMRRGRLLLVRGAHRRHDHLVGLQHLAARGGERAARARGGGRVRGRRGAGRGARPHRQGVRRAGAAASRRTTRSSPSSKEPDRAVQVPAPDRVPRRAPAYAATGKVQRYSRGWRGESAT